MERQTFTSRQTFTTSNAKLQIKRRTFSEGGQERTVTTLVGYPIRWNETSTDRGGYVVKLAPGSANFTKPTMALFHHDFAKPLATTANGTLRLGQADETGIPMELDLNMDTTLGRDTAAMVDRGDVTGLSFSMVNGFEEYTESKEANQNTLTCSKFTSDEITITAIPAFKNTMVDIADDDGEEEKDEEDDYQSPANRIAASQKLMRAKLDMVSL